MLFVQYDQRQLSTSVSREGKAIGSVRLFSFYLLNRLSTDLWTWALCACVGDDQFAWDWKCQCGRRNVVGLMSLVVRRQLF